MSLKISSGFLFRNGETSSWTVASGSVAFSRHATTVSLASRHERQRIYSLWGCDMTQVQTFYWAVSRSSWWRPNRSKKKSKQGSFRLIRWTWKQLKAGGNVWANRAVLTVRLLDEGNEEMGTVLSFKTTSPRRMRFVEVCECHWELQTKYGSRTKLTKQLVIVTFAL